MPNHFEIGASLPGAADAYTSRTKWTYWILADRGHGAEWERVLRARPQDAASIWSAITRAIRTAPVHLIRSRGVHGTVCGVIVTIELHGRTTPATTVWHYTSPMAAPRLVTAYPTP